MAGQNITALVDEILARARISRPPVPVEEVARNEGATIRSGPMPSELSGFIVREGGETIIGVNSLHHRNRRRFTVAHEIGHLRLHNFAHHVDRRFAVYYRGEGESPLEREANQFAAELLIPRRMVEDFVPASVDLLDEVELGRIAQIFQVSTQALTFRLTNLGSDLRRASGKKVARSS